MRPEYTLGSTSCRAAACDSGRGSESKGNQLPAKTSNQSERILMRSCFFEPSRDANDVRSVAALEHTDVHHARNVGWFFLSMTLGFFLSFPAWGQDFKSS